jgi:hypothetical protein
VDDRKTRPFAGGVREGVLLPDGACDVEETRDDQEHDRQEQREFDEGLPPLPFFVLVAEEATKSAQ